MVLRTILIIVVLFGADAYAQRSHKAKTDSARISTSDYETIFRSVGWKILAPKDEWCGETIELYALPFPSPGSISWGLKKVLEDGLRILSSGRLGPITARCPEVQTARVRILDRQGRTTDKTVVASRLERMGMTIFTITVVTDVPSRLVDAGYRSGPFEGRLTGEPGSFGISVKASHADITGRDRSALASLLEDIVSDLRKYDAFNSRPKDITVSVEIGGRAVQKYTLRIRFDLAFMPELDAARKAMPVSERVDFGRMDLTNRRLFFGTVHVNNALLLEYLYHGLFARARALDPGRQAAVLFNYSVWAHSDRCSAHLPLECETIDFKIQNTTRTVNGFGVQLSKNTKVDSFEIRTETRNAPLFKQNVHHMWGPITGFAVSDFAKIYRSHACDSHVVRRLRENMFRYMNGDPALLASDALP